MAQAKEHLEPPKARKGKEGFSPRALRGSVALWLDFRTLRGSFFVALNHLLCGNLFQQSQETNTAPNKEMSQLAFLKASEEQGSLLRPFFPRKDPGVTPGGRCRRV